MFNAEISDMWHVNKQVFCIDELKKFFYLLVRYMIIMFNRRYPGFDTWAGKVHAVGHSNLLQYSWL